MRPPIEARERRLVPGWVRKWHVRAGGQPSTPERNIESNKNRVADQLVRLITMVDTKVGEMIGYPGSSIFAEIKQNLNPRATFGINISNVHPSIVAHIGPEGFFVRFPETEDTSGYYKLDSQSGVLTPRIHVRTPAVSTELSIHTGRQQTNFHQVRVLRTHADGRMQLLTTFEPNHFDTSQPPHPIVLGDGDLPWPNTHLVYGNLETDGTVSLLEQPISIPAWRNNAKYHAQNQTVEGISAYPSPQVKEGFLVLKYQPHEVRFPLQTNMHEALGDSLYVLKNYIDNL